MLLVLDGAVALLATNSLRGLCSALAVAALLAPGCQRTTDDPLPTQASSALDSGLADAPARRDAASDARCAPTILSELDIEGGFLPPQPVRLRRTVDGDTARFDFPDAADQPCRFLYVNTEESYGERTTDFGERTSAVVAGYLRSAREIVVAVREREGHPGEPDRDDYRRLLVFVFVDGEFLQSRLVREGWSAYYTQFGCAPEPFGASLLAAEAAASAEGLGIWQEGHPTDYASVLARWIGAGGGCRPNPFKGESYCP